MSRFWFFVIFSTVFGLHLLALQSNIQKPSVVVKPKTKITKITLSSAQVIKPTPPKPKVEPKKEQKRLVEPIILPPDPAVKLKRYKKKPKPIPVEEVKEVVEQPTQKVVQQDTSNIKDRYTSLIRRLIRKNLYYPKMAKRMRLQGVVRVGFRVRSDGSIVDVVVLNDAKSLLKKGALKTMRRVSPPAIPSELGVDHLDISIPIEFKIKG